MFASSIVPSIDGGAAADISWRAIPLESEDPGLTGMLVLLVFFGAGLLTVYKGFRSYKTSRLIKDTPTETVRSMAVGRTELEGVARDAGTTFDRPFTEGQCLYARYKIEEYDEDAGEDDADWDTIDSGTFDAPFYLEDDTGRALIEADQDPTFELSDSKKTRIKVGRTESEPEEVVEFLRTNTSISVSSGGVSGVFFDDPRRYTEWVLPVDEEVYVFGGAHPRDESSGANEDRLTIATDESTDRFIISDHGEESLASSYTRRAPMYVAFGLLVSSAALFFLLRGLGLG